MEICKSDWKLFREKIPGWQEAYMERLNREYIELLSGDGPASDRFWALEERIKQDRRKPGVLVEMSKSKAICVAFQGKLMKSNRSYKVGFW